MQRLFHIMEVSEQDLEDAQRFLNELLESTRKEAILQIITNLRAAKCQSSLTLRHLENLLKEGNEYESLAISPNKSVPVGSDSPSLDESPHEVRIAQVKSKSRAK